MKKLLYTKYVFMYVYVLLDFDRWFITYYDM